MGGGGPMQGFPRAGWTLPLLTTPAVVCALDSNGTNAATIASANTQADANNGQRLVAQHNYLFNGATWDRWRSLGADQNGNVGAAAVAVVVFNGSNYDRLRAASGADLSATTSTGTLLVCNGSTWNVTNTPAAATQATASKAAGGGTVRHVCTSISGSLAGTANSGVMQLNLRDGASGAGTIKWSFLIAILANTSAGVTISDIAIIGTANTAMTLEFAAAGPANTNQSVTLTGFSTP